MHVSSGLFATVAAGQREIDATGLAANVKDGTWWYVAAGVSQNFFGFGKTVLFGEYLQANDFATHSFGDTSSTAEMWGLGINQNIDAAAAEVYLTYKNYSADVSSCGAVCLEDMQVVMGGMRVNFCAQIAETLVIESRPTGRLFTFVTT
jgi:hypothetical protein